MKSDKNKSKSNFKPFKLSSIVNGFKKRGLAKKLGMLILCILVVPIVIIDIISVSSAVNSVLNESKKSYLAATSATAQYFELVFDSTRDQAMQIMSNEIIQRLYSQSRQITLEDYEKYKLRTDADKMLQNTLVANIMFSGVYVLVNKDNSLVYPYFATDSLDFNKIKSAGWYKDILKADSPTIIGNHREAFDDIINKDSNKLPEYAFSVGAPFKDTMSLQTLGVIVLDVSMQWFRSALQSTHISQHDGWMIAISPEGKIVLPSEWDLSMKHTPDKNTEFISKILSFENGKQTSGAFDTVFDRKPLLVTYAKVADYGWTVVGLVPVSSMMSSARKLEVLIIVFTIIFAILALIIGIYFALRIVRDVEKVTKTLAIAEKGDLTVTLDIKRNDEIGELSQSFNNMSKNIKGLIQKGVTLSEQVTAAISSLATIASETTAASNEVAKAIQEIAEGAGNQAKEASSVVETVSHFGEKIDTIVLSADQMRALSKNVLELSNKGTAAVNTLDNVTDQTVYIAETMIKTINQLSEYSRSIGKIIQVLSSISEQTKLLALNASIEAAKAGDAGRGFAVVASEIRKLADQSKESTREVEDMIKKIVSQTKAAQDVADKVEDVMREQNRAVESVSGTFMQIRDAMDDLFKGIESINESISVIDKEKGVIINNIENISAISQETAASSEEVSASTQEQLAAIEELHSMSEKLNSLAKELQQAMQNFKV